MIKFDFNKLKTNSTVYWFLALTAILWVLGDIAFFNWFPETKAAPGEGTVIMRIDGMADRNKIIANTAHQYELELTVGAGGIGLGTNIQVVVPGGFSSPNSSYSIPGYTEVATDAAIATLSSALTANTIDITVETAALTAGDRVWIRYGWADGGANQTAAALATSTLGTYPFLVKTDDAGGDALTEVSMSPQVTVVSPVKISEIQTNGLNTQTNEFVELYNANVSNIDLAGWDIAYAPYNTTGALTWTEVVEIDPGNHVEIPGYGFFLFSAYGYLPNNVAGDINFASTTSNAFENHGYIAIRNQDNLVIDYVGFGILADENLAEGYDAAPAVSDRSIERKAFGNSLAADMAVGGQNYICGNGYDSDNNANDFVWQPSPKAQNSSSDTETPCTVDGGIPNINHMPVNRAPNNSSLTIIAQIGDPQTEIGVLGAELRYMVGDGTPGNNTIGDYSTAVGVHHSNGYYLFTIPQDRVSASAGYGLYYYIRAAGNGGTGYMCNSWTVAESGVETEVVKYPYVVTIGDPSGWTKYSLSGTASDYDTTSGIADALVFLEGTGYFATTSLTGTYSMADVKADSYRMVFAKNGYYDEWIDNINVNYNLSNINKALHAGSGGGMTGDTTMPYVTFTGPYDGATGLPAGNEEFKVFIGFSKDIAPSTLSSTSVYFLTGQSATATPLSIEYDNQPGDNSSQGRPTADFLAVISAPAGGFTSGLTYYLVLTGNVRDQAGHSLQGNRPEGGHVLSFSIGVNTATYDFGSGANMPPYVMNISPGYGALGVPLNSKIIVNFSANMSPASVGLASTIKLFKVTYVSNVENTEQISITKTLDTTGQIAIITPSANLAASTRYRVVVTGALLSASGICMDATCSTNEVFRTSFETGTATDSSAPTVRGSWPDNGDTGVAVNPGSFFFQFSENLNPTTVSANTVTLKRGTSLVSCDVKYDAMSQSVNVMPLSVLATEANYTLTLVGASSGIKDLAGNALAANYTVNFTTGSSLDTSAPYIMYANGDDYGMAITFSEQMVSAKIDDTANWPKSILNPSNYTVKWGSPAAVSSGGTVIDLSAVNAQIYYDNYKHTVFIENLGLDPSLLDGMDYYVLMGGGTAADLSGNLIASGTNYAFQMPIADSSETSGVLAPSSGSTATYNTYTAGIMKGGAFPMNTMAGQTTVYFVDVPTTRAIPVGGKIVLTFPFGFGVSGAKKDPYALSNMDINGGAEGTVVFSTAAETTGGAENDGVTVDSAVRTVTITTAGAPTLASDYLHFNISGIVNPTIPRSYETSGYAVDIKTLDASGNLLEAVSAMPIYITEAGNITLTVNVSLTNEAVNGTDDNVSVFLGSPMTGPMVKQVSLLGDGTGSTTFTGLSSGWYNIYTNAMVTLDGNDYAGMGMPEPLELTASATKNIVFTRQQVTAGYAAISVDITGAFGTDDIDIFASGPSGNKVKTIYDAADNPSATFYLPDGTWWVGFGPAIPVGTYSVSATMYDWMPPPSVEVRISNGGTTIAESSATANDGAIAFTLNSADKQIVGYVKDGAGAAIADAEVWAYQPGSTGGTGAHARTDTNGKFTLKLTSIGNYKIGAYKSGLPNVPERSVVMHPDGTYEGVGANPADDGNASADNLREDGSLITLSSPFVIRLKKPAYTISGKLTDGINPIAYAPVWADLANGIGHADAMTDTTGNFILYVDNGTWNLNGYIPNYGNADMKTVIVYGTNVTQNLSKSSATYYTISGTVDLDSDGDYSDDYDNPLSYLPIRAVKYDASGVYQNLEYGAMTDTLGNYTISVPAGIYRVDIWTPDYGELGINNLNNNDVLNEAADDAYPLTPANVNALSGNVDNADIIIAQGELRPVSAVFTNAQAGQEGYLNIDGVDFSSGYPKPTGFHKTRRISDLSATSTLYLGDGDYFFFLEVPGTGRFVPDASDRHITKDDIVITATTTVHFTLPVSGSGTVVVSGTVTDNLLDPLANTWVWINNQANGYRTGTQADANGDYSISVPVGSGYKMGAEKPGYLSGQPISLNIAAATSTDFTLTRAGYTITGYLYADANSNSQYDAGEGATGGYVRAETVECANSDLTDDANCKRAHAPADGSGLFTLSVVNGTWKLYGMADGYAETLYASDVAISGAGASANIKLSVNDNWTNRSKMKPITPASGGSLDDTAPGGTGVKLIIPPNAFGNSSSAGNVNTNRTAAVTKTNSSDPLGNEGVRITAQDSAGQAITNLNDYIDITMVVYKADVDAGLADETLSYEKLKSTENAYWDASLNDWVNITTTRNAYYKNDAGDTEWTLYASTTNAFEAFVDELEAGTITPADYKLVYTSKTNHLTIFAVIMPFVATPAQAGGEPEPEPEPAPVVSTGGGGSFPSTCRTVVYGEWKTECVNGLQSRDVVTITPSGCVLSTEQKNDQKRACTALAEEETEVAESSGTEIVPVDSSAGNSSIDQLYLDQGGFIARAEVAEIMPALGITERNHEGERLSRGTLINRLKIDLSKLAPKEQYALTNFITYGSPDTAKLGWGERAGVLNSFKAAFGKVPTTAGDWSDIIKIANGRWPTQRSAGAETAAASHFRKIYLRAPDRKNAHDDAAVTVIAYGLRPAKRNMNSEASAARIFKAIYGRGASAATDWDIVRAIAYSGAVR